VALEECAAGGVELSIPIENPVVIKPGPDDVAEIHADAGQNILDRLEDIEGLVASRGVRVARADVAENAIVRVGILERVSDDAALVDKRRGNHTRKSPGLNASGGGILQQQGGLRGMKRINRKLAAHRSDGVVVAELLEVGDEGIGGMETRDITISGIGWEAKKCKVVINPCVMFDFVDYRARDE